MQSAQNNSQVYIFIVTIFNYDFVFFYDVLKRRKIWLIWYIAEYVLK